MAVETERILCNEDDFRSVHSHLMRSGEFFIAGSASISVPSLKVKYLNERTLRLWPDSNGELVLLTPGEAARCELTRAFPEIRKVGWKGPNVKLFDKRPPMHYEGRITSDNLIYIDLKSAYWQLYRTLWLDVSWPRGLYGKYPLLGVASRLERWKPARNAVIGIVRSREIVGYKSHKRIVMSAQNKFLSPGLWGSVQDILHAIAYRALEFGAIYINTDGYLFDGWEGADKFMSYLGQNELVFDIRDHGPGEVRGWNNYKVGKTSTKVYQLNLPHYNKEFSSVNKQPSGKWEKYLSRTRLIIRSSLNN